MQEDTDTLTIYQDVVEEYSDVSSERLERLRQELQDLEEKVKLNRKERFKEKKNLEKSLKQFKQSETELQNEVAQQRRRHEAQRSVESRMTKKLQEICSSLDAGDLHSVKEVARARHVEKQLEVLKVVQAAPETSPISLSSCLWSDVEAFRTALTGAETEIARKEAEHVEIMSKARQLKEELASTMLREVKAELAQLPPSDDEAEEIRQLQQQREDLLRRLEAPPTSTAAVNGVATTVVAKAAASATVPIAAKAAVATTSAPPVATVVSTLSSLGAGATASTASSPPVATVVSVASAPPVSVIPPGSGTPAAVVSETPATSAAAASSTQATPSAKGKGKGKGKGAPPPPLAGKAPPPRRPTADAVLRKSNLLNLHWKVTRDPPETDPSSKDKGFFAKTAKLAADFEQPTSSASSDSQMRVLALEASRRAERRQELKLSAQVHDLASTAGEQRDTVFSTPVDVQTLPASLLEVYFKARTTSIKMPSADGGDSASEVRPALIDKKFLQMLGICIQKYVMAHKGETEASAVKSIKRGVLQCDYDVVKQEALALIRGVLIAHREEGSKVTKLVEEKGEEALLQLEQSVYHRLVYELQKVPQIDERLECMLFCTDFDRGLRQCTKHLEVFTKALHTLDSKREILGKFFSTALKIGQGLNRDSRAPQAERGFQLTSIDKLVQTKSTKSPRHNVLHFVLALMQPEDVRDLFTADDIALLHKAKALKSYIVYQDCVELVQGFYGLREICETGNYKSRGGTLVEMKRRRKTMVQRPKPEEVDSEKENEPPIDTDDRFHEAMKVFVESNVDAAQGIAQGVFEAFKIYKELAFFFDDLASVWPPPRDENGTKVDLVAVFHGLALHVRVHSDEIEQDGLRALIAPTVESDDVKQDGLRAPDTPPASNGSRKHGGLNVV